MDNPKAKLFAKILRVQQSLQPLEKSGRNDFHRYSYTTAGDVLLPVQRACNEHGLVIVADVIDTKINPERAAAEVIVRLTVFDSETGESYSITAPGYSEDWSYKDNKPVGDKAIYKAVTGATKYAVRSFFCLPSEDDPERTPKRSANSTTLFDQTTMEVKRLGWSAERGRLFLQEKFGKSSRQELTEQELQKFLTHLRSLPSPSIADTRN